MRLVPEIFLDLWPHNIHTQVEKKWTIFGTQMVINIAEDDSLIQSVFKKVFAVPDNIESILVNKYFVHQYTSRELKDHQKS